MSLGLLKLEPKGGVAFITRNLVLKTSYHIFNIQSIVKLYIVQTGPYILQSAESLPHTYTYIIQLIIHIKNRLKNVFFA